MVATAAGNRPPPARPVPNGGNLQTHANSGVPHSVQQDPGPHGSSQEPGPSSHPQQPVFARPVLYVHAPPPPPFLPYQWPMPFSYNPFAGFPGMGYGMVIPPFPPPPPYMEAPAYILPHPHIQPVDYRRLVHAPGTAHQNPNQTRRFFPPHTVLVRETVNSEVQTEPTQRGRGDYEGCPLLRSDSGNATATNSPSSSTSSSQKQDSDKGENFTLPHSDSKDSQDDGLCSSTTVKHSFNIIRPTESNAVQSYMKSTQETKLCKDTIGQEPPLIPHCRNVHCNMWSVSSPDGLVPVCSSSQREDGAVKERRLSVPDILMSWGGGTPQTTMLKMADQEPQNDQQLPSYETNHEKSVYQNPAETRDGPVMDDSAAIDVAEGVLSSSNGELLFKILRLPSALFEPFSDSRTDGESVELFGSVRQCLTYRDELLPSLHVSHKLPENEQESGNETNPHEDSTEFILNQMSQSSCQLKRKMNESIWSVESLAPFIPSKEWLLQNGLFEPEVIELPEETEDGGLSTQNDNPMVKANKERRQACRFSSSDGVPMSESWLIFSTPAEKTSPPKRPEMETETDVSEMRGSEQEKCPSEKDPLASPTPLLSKGLCTPNKEDMDENGSSEPEASQSPNQESLLNKQEEKSTCSAEETLLLNSEAEEKISAKGQLALQKGGDTEMEDGACGVGQVSNKEPLVPVADQKMPKVSPSKGHLVDCGIQCTDFKCPCEASKICMDQDRKHPYKNSDGKTVNNGKAEMFCVNEYVLGNPKRHGQWRNRGQEKSCSQKESSNGYYSKSGKSKGGNGRNPRH